MINKPTWDKAPEWANWLACNADGEWFWYEEKPVINTDFECFTTYYDGSSHGIDSFSYYQEPNNVDNWIDTLEKRQDVISQEIKSTNKKKISNLLSENINAVKWFHTHDCDAVNKRLYFRFYTDSGIGIGVDACCSCGAIEDVTDYSYW